MTSVTASSPSSHNNALDIRVVTAKDIFGFEEGLGLLSKCTSIAVKAKDLITEQFKHLPKLSGLSRAPEVITAIKFPFVVLDLYTDSKTLTEHSVKSEKGSLAALSVATGVSSFLSSIAVIAKGIHFAVNPVADSAPAWTTALGTVGGFLSVFGIAASSMGLYYTNRVEKEIDEALDANPDTQLEQVKSALKTISERLPCRIKKHFNLVGEQGADMQKVLQNQLSLLEKDSGRLEESKALLQELKGRLRKKTFADKVDLAISVIAFATFIAFLVSNPAGWAVLAVGITIGLTGLGVMLYRLKTAGEKVNFTAKPNPNNVLLVARADNQLKKVNKNAHKNNRPRFKAKITQLLKTNNKKAAKVQNGRNKKAA